MAAPFYILFFVFWEKGKGQAKESACQVARCILRLCPLYLRVTPLRYAAGFPLGDHNARIGRIDALQSCVP